VNLEPVNAYNLRRNQHYRTGGFFKNRHSHIIDPAQTHFYRLLMTSQNDQVGFVMFCYFADFKCRISRQTSECDVVKIIQERLHFSIKSVLGFLIYFQQLGVTAIQRLQPIIQGMKNVQFGPIAISIPFSSTDRLAGVNFNATRIRLNMVRPPFLFEDWFLCSLPEDLMRKFCARIEKEG